MVVVDASVAYKWFVTEDEEHLNQALGLLQTHLHNPETIIVPDLIVHELSNAWTTKTKLSSEEVRTFIDDLESIKLNFESFNFELLKKVVEFSKKYQTTAYDATYAVFAAEKKCDLITADKKFVEKVNLPFVKYLGDYPTGKAVEVV